MHLNKFNIFIIGCYYNYDEANKITQLLNQMGYLYTKNQKEADYIFVISCSVRQKPIDRIYGNLKKWNKFKKKPKIIVSGCILPKDKKTLKEKVFAIVDSRKLEYEIKNIIPDLNNKIKPCEYLYPNDIDSKTAFIPIMQGCNNFCTYCAVPFTRGREISRESDEIINDVKNKIKKGFSKFILLGQNVNSYKPKSRTTFAKLLMSIDKFPGNFKFNFTSPNPRNFSDELINTLPNLNKWERIIHIPMQSGNNDILNKMNRKYTSAHYISLISKIKKQISNIKITTDIIVGFPGETKKQFEDTYNLCKKIEFDKVFVAQYSPRPGTYADKNYKDDILPDEKKRRWKRINNLINI